MTCICPSAPWPADSTDKLLLHLTTNAANAVEKARDTPAAKTAAIRNQELATFILQETKEAATVEDLVYLEMALQKYDFLTAKTAADQKSIRFCLSYLFACKTDIAGGFCKRIFHLYAI